MRMTVFIAGLIFGIGLAVSGMVNPVKVLSFLDLAGHFDATLILVMGAGLITTMIGYCFVFRRKTPFFDEHFHLPTLKAINLRLVTGSALFGVGWGLGGFCPGPAVASLAYFHWQSILFVVAMAAGALAARTAFPEP